MKKALSFVLALVLLLSVSATAFADGEKTTPQAVTSVDVWKQYSKTAAAPAETFKFTVTADSVKDNDLTVSDMPSLANPAKDSGGVYSVTFNAETVDSYKSVTNEKFTINLAGKFNRVGTYTYKIEETSGDTAGVEYDNTPVYLVITVLAGADGNPNQYYVALHEDSATGDKVGNPNNGEKPAFTNTFTATTPTPPSGGDDDDPTGGGDEDNKVTALSLKKTISGNYADDQQYFDFKVVFTIPKDKTFNGTISVSDTSYKDKDDKGNPTTITKGTDGKYTATFKLKANETLQFGSVPVGMTYSFTETATNGYTATLSDDCSGTVEKDKNIKAVIDNYRNTTTPTGISLDSLPYVIILATVAAAALFIVLKKRAKRA